LAGPWNKYIRRNSYVFLVGLGGLAGIFMFHRFRFYFGWCCLLCTLGFLLVLVLFSKKWLTTELSVFIHLFWILATSYPTTSPYACSICDTYGGVSLNQRPRNYSAVFRVTSLRRLLVTLLSHWWYCCFT
jgi:hypothetical protein